ncbi:hypothetical protein [Thermodesulfitimonas autotrophica]|uniref:hypothetical protein n=1 Tax=Thermodesulfitimonas autotrophica TaxID=1894989 RepID=UPI001B87BF82|nr:hypothetical protein [Thermodesulfitimonas autotrophica]
MKKIARFRWDTWNINHIAKHGVRPEEAEEVFSTNRSCGKAVAAPAWRWAGRTPGGCWR